MTDSNGYVLKTAKVVTTADLFVDSYLSARTCAYEAYVWWTLRTKLALRAYIFIYDARPRFLRQSVFKLKKGTNSACVR